MTNEEIMKEVFGLIEDVLDTLIEVGNGTTDEMLHEAADELFRVRDLLKKTVKDQEQEESEMEMSEEDKKLILEELQKDAEKDKKHAYGVWYPVSDPPECDMYGIVLCVNGKRGNARYVHAVYQDNCNCYEEGKFWPGGIIDPNLTVDAWLKLPACPIDITASK